MTAMSTENVIIIGGGPAGLSAAIYNSRANLNPLVFAGSPPGGQLTLTSDVENFPGYDSILGPELIMKLRNQAIKFGSRIIDENVVKVDFSGKIKTVFVQRQSLEKIEAKTILIATGAKALWLGLESEKRLRGKGVSACATCDGFFFKGKTVAVIGGGDTAMEEATTLTKFASKVYLIHRRDSFRASKIMIDKVINNPKIEIIYNAVVEEILGENRVEGIRIVKSQLPITNYQSISNNQLSNENFIIGNSLKIDNSKIENLKLDGVFIAIGHKPDTDLFQGKIELDEKGYIISKNRLSYDNLTIGKIDQKKLDHIRLETHHYGSGTSIDGVFAAGDCVDYLYKQAATAAGMGVAAAMDIERYLQEDK